MSANKSNVVEIVEGIKKGELPTERQIAGELDPVKDFLQDKERTAKTDEQEKVMHEARMTIQAFEELLCQKNLSEKMKRILDASKRVAEKTEPKTVTTGAVWRETQKFIAEIKLFVPDILQSREFRESILEMAKVLRDILNMKKKEAGLTENKMETAFVEGDTKTAKDTIKDAAKEIKDTKLEDIPEDQKQRIRESIKTLLRQLRDNSNASKAFQRALNLWDMLSNELTAQLNREKSDPDVREVEEAARDLIDSFAQGKTDKFVDSIKSSVDMIQNDQELQNYLKDFRQFLRKGLENPENIDSDKYWDEGDELVKRGRRLSEKYKDNECMNRMVDCSYDLVDAIKNDEQINNFQYRLKKLRDSFTYTDIAGKKHVDFDLVTSMRSELVPFLIERIQDIPVPGFRIENDDFEYLEVDNLKLKLNDILPDNINIHARNDTDITPKDFDKPTKSETVVRFKLDGIRPVFEDFYFRFKRRGIISMKDEGRARLSVIGKGINMRLDFDVDVDTNNKAMLTSGKVEIHVDAIDVDIKEAEHKTLLNMLSTFFAPKLKSELEKALKQRMTDITGDWANQINKRVLSTMPIPSITEATAKVIMGDSSIQAQASVQQKP